MPTIASILRPLCGLVLCAAASVVGCIGPSEKEVQMARDRRDIAADHMNRGEYRDALRELRVSEELNPNDPELHYNMAVVYAYGFKRYDDARTHLDRARRLRDEYSEAENLYGITYLEEERYQEAIPHFERALENLVYSTPQFARQNLGWALYKSGRVAEGMEQLRLAVGEAPDLCGAYYWLGLGHAEQGKNADAVRWWEAYRERCDGTKLSSFVPPAQRAEVLHRLGLAYNALGDPARARVVLEDCVVRFPKVIVAEECRRALAALPPPPAPEGDPEPPIETMDPLDADDSVDAIER